MTFSRRSASEAISNGDSAETSSTKSAERRVVLLADRLLQRDRLLGDAHDVAHLAHACTRARRRAPRRSARARAAGSARRSAWISLFSRSTMCTGMRIVRPLSASARVTAWRIHQVA